MADSRVLATTRRIHIRLRVAVLRDSSHFRRFRPARPYETAVLFQNLVSVGFPLGFQPRPSKRYAFFGGYAARNKAALGTSGRVRRDARGLGLTPAPCAAAPVVFAAIRAAMLRRRDTVSSPCDVSHCAFDEPRRCMSFTSALTPSSLASPSIRRVFLRSFCTRRRPVSSLNLICRGGGGGVLCQSAPPPKPRNCSAAARRSERGDSAYSPRVPRGGAFGRRLI